jgi:hypothetical protein
MPERLEYLIKEFHFPIQELIADKGYGRGPAYEYCRLKSIRNYIPLHDENLGHGRISKGEFRYDRKNDRYICPQDKFLYPYEKTDRGIKRYRVLGGHCSTCPLKAQCLPKNHQNRARFVYRNPFQDLIDGVRKRMGTQVFKAKLLEPKWKIEGLFAEAKENHHLRKMKYRGLIKAQIQIYLTALVQNLKRLTGKVKICKNILQKQELTLQ